MDGVLHQVFSGIASGGIYASIALALVMIFTATHHVNFAQGEMGMFATYIALTLIQAGVPYWAAFLITVAFAMAVGIIIQKILMEPLMNAPVLASVGVFIGLLFIFNSVAGWIFTYTLKPFPTPFGEGGPLFGGFFSRHELGSTVITLIVLLSIWAFFRFTRLGLAMRAEIGRASCRERV